MSIRTLRLASGLILASYILLHCLNHALGLISIEAMELMRRPMHFVWTSPPGTLALYGSLLLHFALALWGLFQRRSLNLPRWERGQALLGLLLPPLLIGHAVGTRGALELLAVDVDYSMVLVVLWSDSWFTLRNALLLIVAWLHLAFGLHFWLRIKPFYPRWLPLFYPLAVLLPVLALLGYWRGGMEILARIAAPERLAQLMAPLEAANPAQRALLATLPDRALAIFFGLLAAVLLARWLRHLLHRHVSGYRISLPSGQVLHAAPGSSVLETIRGAGLPHAAVCGGRGRCTTCRVRVGLGRELQPPPVDIELSALNRIGAAEEVRLACQLHPAEDLSITPLLPPSTSAAEARRAGGVDGHEEQVVILFLDLRGSTALAEKLLPYDVVFILNAFFAEMTAALEDTGGHYAQFNGDGLMALYGLDEPLPQASRNALSGALQMLKRLETLNQRLQPELGVALRMGIGLHCGEAIVGHMGPPSTPLLTAVGDNVNIAARLESLTKEYRCEISISADSLRAAGLDGAYFGQPHAVAVRGRAEPVPFVAVDDIPALAHQLTRQLAQ